MANACEHLKSGTKKCNIELTVDPALFPEYCTFCMKQGWVVV